MCPCCYYYMWNIFRKLTWPTRPRRSKLSYCRRYDTPSPLVALYPSHSLTNNLGTRLTALTAGRVTVLFSCVQVLAASDADADEEGVAPMTSKPQVHHPPYSHFIFSHSSFILLPPSSLLPPSYPLLPPSFPPPTLPLTLSSCYLSQTLEAGWVASFPALVTYLGGAWE